MSEAFQNPPGDQLSKILLETKVIAMVGASGNPARISHGIMKKLQQWGYKVIPVNPNEAEILGEKAYPSLLSVPEKIDIVNVFRKPEHTPQVADEAVKIGARVLWLQLGIANGEAADIARKGGLTVIMDACIAVVHHALQIPEIKA